MGVISAHLQHNNYIQLYIHTCKHTCMCKHKDNERERVSKIWGKRRKWFYTHIIYLYILASTLHTHNTRIHSYYWQTCCAHACTHTTHTHGTHTRIATIGKHAAGTQHTHCQPASASIAFNWVEQQTPPDHGPKVTYLLRYVRICIISKLIGQHTQGREIAGNRQRGRGRK